MSGSFLRWCIGLALVSSTSLPAMGQRRVPPDRECVAVLQGIQDAHARRDQNQLQNLIADQVALVAYLGGERLVDEKVARQEFIKRLIETTAETEHMSPFVDGVPVSKRILYAESIDGGQRLRVLLLNRPVAKTAQTVSWVMDLGITRKGGALRLTEAIVSPPDFDKAVLGPFFKEAIEGKFGDDDAKSIAAYNRYWDRFAATLPKPEAAPVGPKGPAPRPVAQAQFPVRPTAFTPIPNPPPVTLPPAQVTPRVRQWRAASQAILQQQFTAFLDRQIAEYFQPFQGRRYYFNVYQNQYRASYGQIVLVINVRLVFVQPPQGPMSYYMVPVIRSENPPVRQPQPIPQTPVALKPPPARATGCMVLTDTAKLKAKHGQRYDQIKRYLDSFGPIIDLAGKNIGPGDSKLVDDLVEKNFDRASRDCLFIFGHHDVVPHAIYPNPTQGTNGDPDTEILSDDPYGDFDHDAHQDPEIMVVRMPDDPGILEDSSSVLYRTSASNSRLTLTDYAVYGNRNRSSPSLLAQLASPGKANLLLRSTPSTAETFARDFFRGHNVLINLHGSNDVSNAYWGEEADHKQLTAMSLDHATAPDGVVWSCACYGGSTIHIQTNGTVVPKTSDEHIGLRFLRNGASAFVGYTRVTWQAVAPEAFASAEGLAPKRFIELTRQGNSPQKAFQLVKREMATMIDRQDPTFKKMHHQRIYLGLPPVGSRAVSPVATPDRPAGLKTQLARVMEKASDAARQQNPESLARLMTPSVRESFTQGPEVPARDKAQQLIDQRSRPDAANPLAIKPEELSSRIVLVEKVADNEYAAHLRVPYRQSVLPDPSLPKQELETVQRVKFKREGDEFKISAVENKNQEFIEQVVQPHVQWVKQNNPASAEEAKDKYDELMESFVANTVAKAASSDSEATAALNPLAPIAAAGQPWPAWALPSAIGAGVLLILLVVVATMRRPTMAMAGGGSIPVTCPRCGARYSVAPESAGQQMRCGCGNLIAVPHPMQMQAMPPAAPGYGAPPIINVNTAPVYMAGAPAMGLPYRESRIRTRSIIFFGLLLVAAFFIPEITPSASGGITARFTALEMLGEKDVPVILKVLMAVPAAAAVMAFILAFATDSRIRGLLLCAIPWVPVVLVAMNKEYRSAFFTGELEHMFDGVPWPLLAGAAGVLLMWIGARARWYRPGYHLLYLLGLAGAVGFALMQSVPIGPEGSQIVVPVAMLHAVRDSQGFGPKVFALFSLFGPSLVALSALLLAFNFPGRRPSISGQAGAAFRLIVVAMLISLCLTQVQTVQLIAHQDRASGFAMSIALLKGFFYAAGLILMFLGGMVDLIIGPAPRQHASGYDMAPG